MPETRPAPVGGDAAGEGSPRIYRAENVGSLLRPARLKEAIAEHLALPPEQQEANRTALRELENEVIRDAVARQEATGIDVVTDGEFRRLVFVNSFYDAITGVTPSKTFTFRNDAGEQVETPPLYVVSGHLEQVDSPGAREAGFMTSVATKPFKVTFPAPSWFASPYLVGSSVPGYDSVEEAVDHMLQILRGLITDTIEAGAKYIQLDYPSCVYLVDRNAVAKLTEMGHDLGALLDTWIDLDRRVLADMPEDVHFSMHICRGNYKSYWMFEGALDPVAERIFNDLSYDSFLVEWEDTEREGDYSALRYVPDGPTIAMGIISSKKARVEDDDEVLRHMEEAAGYVDMDRLALCTQCGFASSVPGNDLDEDAQWRKLELIGRVADRLWPGR
jgi:5-methyltetrahydropteroyltriglutamate--homocysteine methyltransferase